MKTKAVELSLNVIIVAALGLAVLVVFFIIFTSEASDFSKSVLTCEAKGGQCVENAECGYEITSFKCPTKDKPICCINPLER